MKEEIPIDIALKVFVLIVLLVGPLHRFPNAFHSRRDPFHNYPNPSGPDGIILELIYEPERDYQQAHAVYPSEGRCRERDISWLTTC